MRAGLGRLGCKLWCIAIFSVRTEDIDNISLQEFEIIFNTNIIIIVKASFEASLIRSLQRNHIFTWEWPQYIGVVLVRRDNAQLNSLLTIDTN